MEIQLAHYLIVSGILFTVGWFLLAYRGYETTDDRTAANRRYGPTSIGNRACARIHRPG